MIDFVQRPGPSQAFTKAICYGSAQYLDLSQLEAVLVGLRKNHLALQRVVLGNLPDRDREPLFRRGEQATPMDDADSDIGLWWSPADLRVLAERTGWALEVRRMPEAFYAHHYRFDAVLRPFGGPT